MTTSQPLYYTIETEANPYASAPKQPTHYTTCTAFPDQHFHPYETPKEHIATFLRLIINETLKAMGHEDLTIPNANSQEASLTRYLAQDYQRDFIDIQETNIIVIETAALRNWLRDRLTGQERPDVDTLILIANNYPKIKPIALAALRVALQEPPNPTYPVLLSEAVEQVLRDPEPLLASETLIAVLKAQESKFYPRQTGEQQRNRTISFRVTPNEEQILRALADYMTISDYVRRQLLNG